MSSSLAPRVQLTVLGPETGDRRSGRHRYRCRTGQYARHTSNGARSLGHHPFWSLKLQVNGVDRATGSATSVPAFGSATVTVSGTVSIGAGDLTLRALAGTANYLTINSGTNTYVRIT